MSLFKCIQNKSFLSTFFILQAFLGMNCSNIYSPFGIKGADARAEIEETRTIGNVISLPGLQSQVSSTPSDSSTICSFSGSAIVGSTDSTQPTSFTIPKSRGVLDLQSTVTQNTFFQSETYEEGTVDLTKLRIQSIRTANLDSLTENTCAYRITSDCSSPMTAMAGRYILTNQPTLLEVDGTISSTRCLQISCDRPSSLRIRYDDFTSTTSSSQVNFDGGAFLIGPAIFEAMSKIDDNKYYKKKSFDKCKETVLLLSLVQAQQNLQSIQNFNSLQDQVKSCNSLVPTFNTAESNLLANLLQGAVCSLEEVGVLGF